MSVPPTPDRLAIVLTPFARPDVVAAACKQLGMTDAVAVPARSGVVVARPLPPKAEHDDWDIAELFGEAPSAPTQGSPDDAAPAAQGSPDDAAPAAQGSPDDAAPAAEPGAPRGAGGATGEATGTLDDGVVGGAGDGSHGGAGGAAPAGRPGEEGESGDPDRSGEVTAADAVIDPPAPAGNAGEELATAMSTITRRGVVLVTADLGLDTGVETGLAGHVVAREWNAGEPGKDVPPGLLLAGADDVVEDIVLGRRAPDEIPGAIRAADVTGRGPKRRLFGRGI